MAVDDDGDVWIVGPALSPTLIDGTTGEFVAKVRVSARHVLVVDDRVLFTTPDGRLVVLNYP